MEEQTMKLAIPLAEGKLAAHFGHCQEFAIVEVNENQITNKTILIPPRHEPGVLPKWLHDLGADIIIAGGMGQKAAALFQEKNIKVVLGAPALEPEAVVNSYLNNTLETGENICDH
jgi:predicted Fe-Mo cluster-binding NifX family protein